MRQSLLVHTLAELSQFTPSPPLHCARGWELASPRIAAAAAGGESKETVSSVVSRSGGKAVQGGIQLSNSARVADLQVAMLSIHAKNKCTYCKNLLQEWAQKNNLKFPVYCTDSKGNHHQLEFRSTVEVGGKRFLSQQWHRRLKDAEQDAARVAYESLLTTDGDESTDDDDPRDGDESTDDDDPTDVFWLIDQDVAQSKSILYEFAQKTKAAQPRYSVDRQEVLGPMSMFVSSVVFAGNTYFGEAATTKKDAQQKAARIAVRSILATNNNCMKEIIRSKKQLIIAITSAGFNKERAVSQENGNAPKNAITTYQGAVFPTAYQGVNIIPAADPSAQAMSVSKKRKRRTPTG